MAHLLYPYSSNTASEVPVIFVVSKAVKQSSHSEWKPAKKGLQHNCLQSSRIATCATLIAGKLPAAEKMPAWKQSLYDYEWRSIHALLIFFSVHSQNKIFWSEYFA